MKRTSLPESIGHGSGVHIMTNDPSMTAWGWAIISTRGLVQNVGAIKTAPTSKMLRIRKGDDRIRRVSELCSELLALINRYNVKLIFSELPHGSQNAQAAIMIGMVSGIVQTIGVCQGIPVEWFSEGDAKKALLGKQSATKQEIVSTIEGLYSPFFVGYAMAGWDSANWVKEAVADALAVYHVATQQSELLKMLKG